MVHFNSSNGNSSSKDNSDDEDDVEYVSFEDMLEQARAQSDTYPAKDHSDGDDFEPYTFQYKRIHEDSDNCSTRQETRVNYQRGDAGLQYACTPRGGTGPVSGPSSSSSGMSVARRAKDAASAPRQRHVS